MGGTSTHAQNNKVDKWRKRTVTIDNKPKIRSNEAKKHNLIKFLLNSVLGQ